MRGCFRDFVDVYLREIRNNTNSHFDLESLEITCLDLFKAGAETTSTTILWVVLYLVKYQEVQEKCYQEIVRETGEARPSLAHSLPYCQAVLQEVQESLTSPSSTDSSGDSGVSCGQEKTRQVR